MKKEKDEDLDSLFRKKLEDPVNEPAFRDADWDAMEQMLDKRKKRAGIIYWLPLLGSVAALLLLFLGWMFFRPQVVKHTKQEQVAVSRRPRLTPDSDQNKRIKENTGTSGDSDQQVADSSKQKTLPANYANNLVTPGHRQKGKSFLPLSADRGRRDTTGYADKNIAKTPAEKVQNVPVLAANGNNANINKDTAAAKTNPANPQAAKQDSGLLAANSVSSKDTAVNNDQPAKIAAQPAKAKGLKQTKPGYRPQLAIGVIASSDFNGVSSFQQSKIGSNFGLSFSVGLSKKLTLSTGAMYAIKPYLTDISNYHPSYQFPGNISSVNVNCRMIDIPLNLNYQVYSHQGNKFSVGSGLSSYIILREDYKFNYTGTYNYGPSGYSVINKNRNIFGILNLDATYERQINSKVALVLQPYLKLPLSNVGAGQARLQTAGIALGFNWNLNSSSKP
ncbi:MAG TPA: hypothetical protein VK668_01660 [Mucilaginibacter sp.]|nr:hypothetical protein [Mucilaginibacter sp.]